MREDLRGGELTLADQSRRHHRHRRERDRAGGGDAQPNRGDAGDPAPPRGKDGTPVHEYEPGTWGPKEVDSSVAPPGGWQNPTVKSR